MSVALEEKKRNANIDLARIMAMLFVIAVHIPPYPYDDDIVVYTVLSPIVFLLPNHLFFALSGFLNIDKAFNCREDYRNFYVSRLINIVFPFLVVSLAIYLGQAIVNQGNISFEDAYLWFNSRMYTETHLWFVCVLIGCILSTPFLSKAVHAMEDFELNIVFAISLIWAFCAECLTTNLGIPFHFGGWPFSGYFFCYFAGFYCKRVVSNWSNKKIVIVGLFFYFLTIASQILERKYNIKFL